jgi:hypothetical protein
MNEIRQILKLASRRLEFSAYLGRLHLVATIVAAVAFVLMLVAAPLVPWFWVGPVMLALALGIAALVWMRRRLGELRVAVAVDERLKLQEKLSTALHCRGRDDAFAQAAIEDAVSTARDRRTHERVRRLFRVGAPAGWWMSPLIVLLVIMAWFVRPLDMFRREATQAPDVIQAKQEAEQSVEAVVKAIEEKPALSRELSDMLGELSRDGVNFDAERHPEEVKREAIKKVTDINRRLDDILNGERGKTAEALDRKLSKLKSEDGQAKALSDALAKGDFKAAQAALKQMMDKINNGELDKQQQEELAKQLKDIAKQLDQLANQQEQLAEALKQAGMDPQLAQNAQALQQALQNNQNLNDQQKQQLQQMAQAQQAAAGMCQGLGQACQQMAQGMQDGQMGQMGEGQQGMNQQLNQLEQMQMLLQEAQAAASQCQGMCQGLGQGLGMQQAMQQWKQGGAFNNAGQGRGGRAPIAPTPTGTKMVKADTKLTSEGDIIARQIFDGPQVRGESQAEMRQVVRKVDEGYDEATNEEDLPRRYHEAQLHYFGELKKLTEAKEAEPAADSDD